MARNHIESKDLYGETACGRNYDEVEDCMPREPARRKIRKSGIGNFCRSCARAEGLYTPIPTYQPAWRKKLAKAIRDRLCKGAHGCDAGAQEENTGPCAGCSSMLEIATDMNVIDLVEAK